MTAHHSTRPPRAAPHWLVLPALTVLVAAGGCHAPEVDRADYFFVDRTEESGLTFTHVNGMSGEFYLPEIMGPGVALLDYDNDGDLDVYMVQGQLLGAPAPDATRQPIATPTDRLFRNDLEVRADGSRTLRFTDVTHGSGIGPSTYGMGVATGDVNNDGFVDIYRTSLGPNTLLLNNGDGTFSDASSTSGTSDPGWGVSASFVDIDRDGWLDLYVGNYVDYTVEGDIDCIGSALGRIDYCAPKSYPAQADRLYRNQGHGVFTDVSAVALPGAEPGPTLGVSTADFDGDGWMDIYVAIDGAPNQLWINQHDGSFTETGLRQGAALNVNGIAESSMGVDAGDADGDGDEDLFLTHWRTHSNTLYVNNGRGHFRDATPRSGLGPPSLAKTGFGAAWVDVDNDGHLDLPVVNGAVSTIQAQARSGDPFPLRERNQVFLNTGDGRFEEGTERAWISIERPNVSRGAAFGDIDNDGDTDILIGNNSGATRLLINEIGSRHHWVGLRLVGGRDMERDMLGARIQISRADGSSLWRRVHTDGSYASASDPRVLVGLGTSPHAPRVRVNWPDGRMDDWIDVPVDQWTTLRPTGP